MSVTTHTMGGVLVLPLAHPTAGMDMRTGGGVIITGAHRTIARLTIMATATVAPHIQFTGEEAT